MLRGSKLPVSAEPLRVPVGCAWAEPAVALYPSQSVQSDQWESRCTRYSKGPDTTALLYPGPLSVHGESNCRYAERRDPRPETCHRSPPEQTRFEAGVSQS